MSARPAVPKGARTAGAAEGTPVTTLWHKLLAGVVAAAALAGVFALYLRPDFMVTLADQMWACF